MENAVYIFIPDHEKMCVFTTIYTIIICCGCFMAHMAVFVLLSKIFIVSCFHHIIKIVVDPVIFLSW